MKYFFIIVSVSLMLVGVDLYSKAKSLESTIETMNNNIIDPVHSQLKAFANNSTFHIDEETYIENATSSILGFTIESFQYQRALNAGAMCFIAGLTLLVATTRDNLNKFFQSLVGYAT